MCKFKTQNLSKNSVRIFLLIVVVASSVYAAADIPFDSGPSYGMGLNMRDLRFVDLDGDGFLDMIGPNGGQGNPDPKMTFRFGDSSGGYGPPVVIDSPIIGECLSVGDLNNDGKPDVVVASFYQNAIEVFVNQGNRTFATPVVTIPPDPPWWDLGPGEFLAVEIADFDGDGSNDVVALQDQSDQRLRFFHFNPDGTLTTFATLNQASGGTSYEAEMALGDINGDGRSDIILAGGGPFGVREFRFVLGQSAGGLLSIVDGFRVIDKAIGIVVEDLDGDHDSDLAVAFLDTTTPTQHSAQIFRNNGTGEFTALPKIVIDYPFPPYSITATDFNNDGKRDLCLLLAGIMVHPLYGNGDLTFQEGSYYAAAVSHEIQTTDIDSDGNADLLLISYNGLASDYSAYDGVSTSGIKVMYGDSHGFKAPLLILWGPNFIDAQDFNNDGFLDMASAWQTSFVNPSGVDLMMNDHRGSFILPETHQPSSAALTGMKTGDFNGDGKWDAISIHDDNSRVLSFYQGNGNGSLATPINTQFSKGLVNVVAANFNSDEISDAFVIDDSGQGYVALGQSTGSFVIAPGSPFQIPFFVKSLASGDFNNDGNDDLVVQFSSSMEVYLSDGEGRLINTPTNLPVLLTVGTTDINGDGIIDIVGMKEVPSDELPPWRTDHRITCILGDGTGNFSTSFSKTIPNFSFSAVQSLVSADFDHDGFNDVALIMRDNTFGNLIVIPSGGSMAEWKDPVFHSVGPATRNLIAKDFNGDGTVDLGFSGDHARGVIYNSEDHRKPSSPFDFDGDGQTDISVFRPDNGQWWYLRSLDLTNRAFTFGTETDLMVPGDYTGDRKTDVAFFRPSTGTWFVLRSEDSAYYAFPFGLPTDIPAPADYDGDGKTDAAVYRPSNGLWYIFRSSDGAVSFETFGGASDRPVPADYDGDGKADVAVVKPTGSTGSSEWWIMRSSDHIAHAFLFGTAADKAVPGDYTGDGAADIAFFRPSSGSWYVLRSEDSLYYAFPFGQSTDIPTPGDYDGDGRFDAAVYRSASGTWFINQTTQGVFISTFGEPTDIPVPSAFVK